MFFFFCNCVLFSFFVLHRTSSLLNNVKYLLSQKQKMHCFLSTFTCFISSTIELNSFRFCFVLKLHKSISFSMIFNLLVSNLGLGSCRYFVIITWMVDIMSHLRIKTLQMTLSLTPILPLYVSLPTFISPNY